MVFETSFGSTLGLAPGKLAVEIILRADETPKCTPEDE